MSEPNTFTGVTIDRATDGRRSDEGWVASLGNADGARTLLLGDAGVAVDPESSGADLARAQRDDPGDDDGGGLVLLGLENGAPLYAFDEDEPPLESRRPSLIGAGGRRGEPPVHAEGRMGLREAAAALSQSEGALAAYATALLNWHRAHRFCANCGAATGIGEVGMSRVCPSCGTHHHPRVDPVVIMLVTGESRLLLGRQPSWPAQRYSALAGFVSPGESLEEAVAREVREEAGVEVDAPEYVSSQPWPFPASLMLAFEVPWLSGAPGGADDELEDVRWFSRDEVAAAAERDESWDGDGAEGELQLPPRTAIARRLIEWWLG